MHAAGSHVRGPTRQDRNRNALRPAAVMIRVRYPVEAYTSASSPAFSIAPSTALSPSPSTALSIIPSAFSRDVQSPTTMMPTHPLAYGIGRSAKGIKTFTHRTERVGETGTTRSDCVSRHFSLQTERDLHTNMDDPVRPSEQKFRKVYEFGFRTWAGLNSDVINNPSLSEICFNTFRQQPHFPPNLKLQHVQSTLWVTSQKNDDCELPSFQQQLQLSVGVKKPVLLSVTNEPEESRSYATWFKHGGRGTMVGSSSSSRRRLQGKDRGRRHVPVALVNGCLITHGSLSVYGSILLRCQAMTPQVLRAFRHFAASNSAQSASPPASAPVPPESSACHWLYYDEREFDKLLTLSCHTRGIRPLLLSVFYDPRVECNTVAPWLQGTISAIDSLVGERQDVLGRMLMKRSPTVSSLWLGATVLGLQKSLFQHIRYGSIPVDLPSAVFSGTVQTFLQLPVSAPPADKGFIPRADECRLLYLSRSEYHTRVPIYQWKPFGTTPVADTDIEVRMHKTCIGHRLQYRGIVWNCVDDVSQKQDVPTPVNSTLNLSPPHAPSFSSMQPISYKGMNYDKEGVSENATRSILTWLRFDGCAQHEGDIWKHEWFDVLDSEDEDDDAGDEKSGGYGDKGQVSSRVQKWRFEVASL
ncbi:hypothetical protein ACRALDRAFT_1092362 [Sodiomyces alcalophilus JCM 7366]|uniref:uncharacterized protein n=1 Tax=Sodiomyces alcalophilus JCM 7366 TaxID=591952 RepID=UPI0039B4E833